MKIYVVTVQSFKDDKKRVSSEGYTKREDAVKFIESRSDYREKGFHFNDYRYISHQNIYEICEINF